jgi:hypothetical protein
MIFPLFQSQTLTEEVVVEIKYLESEEKQIAVTFSLWDKVDARFRDEI